MSDFVEDRGIKDTIVIERYGPVDEPAIGAAGEKRANRSARSGGGWQIAGGEAG